MSVEYAPRGLVGALTPQANTTVEPEFSILWPPGVAMINARLMSPKPSLEARLLDYFDQADEAVKQFHNAPVDVVALASTGVSYLAGISRENETVARLEQKLGVPFITSAHAVIQALQALKAERIGLVSPYPASLTQASVVYWEANGFEVARIAEVAGDAASFHPIYSIHASGARDALAAMRGDKLDAIVMLGTGMPTLAPILEASNLVECPVMSCMLCLGWACVEAIDRGRARSAATLRSWIAGEGWGARLAERRWTRPAP
jgi:maleate isomerase